MCRLTCRITFQLSQSALRTKELEESVDREKYDKEKHETNVGELNDLIVTLQLQLQVNIPVLTFVAGKLLID